MRFIRTWCPEYSQEDLRKPTFAKRAAPKTLNRTGKAEKGKEGKGKGKGKGKRYPAGGSPAGLPSAEMLDAMDKSTKVCLEIRTCIQDIRTLKPKDEQVRKYRALEGSLSAVSKPILASTVNFHSTKCFEIHKNYSRPYRRKKKASIFLLPKIRAFG